MDERQTSLPLAGVTPPAMPAGSADGLPILVATSSPGTVPRWFAILQVILVCGIPTQILAGATLALVAGVPVFDGRGVSFEFVVMTSLVDTAVIALLIRLFLILSGESSASVFVGTKPIGGEVLRGLALLPVVFAGVMAVVVGLRAVAPWMHNVDKSPFENYLHSPLEASIFFMVAVLAGGVREELQRGFILHRFEQRLGGIKVGLAAFTLMFGALHADQGIDVATAVGLLGLFWGIVYIKRRSVVLSMVNHASFNGAQVIQAFLARSLGA